MSAHGYEDSHDQASTMDSSNGLSNGKSISPDAMAISTPSAESNVNSFSDEKKIHVKFDPDTLNPTSASASATASASDSASPAQSVNADLAMKKSPSDQETVGGDILVKEEPGQPPKLSRSSSQKVVSRPPPLFDHLPDSTQDALATFEQIEACWYANKYMGYTEHAMECDCAEEWGKFDPCRIRGSQREFDYCHLSSNSC